MSVAPLRLALLHRGPLPSLDPDPWADGGPRLMGLARALAISPGWASRTPATLVVRGDLLAALGRFDDAAIAWLSAAGQQLAATLPQVVWLDAPAVERACRALADALADRFGVDALRTFRYAAVPRGGLFVLGHLAYLLDLPAAALTPEPGSDAPLVVVDDAAVSGLRLAGWLAARPERRFVVATLHAHPDLRSALVAHDPRVEAFLSAHDLHDLAPDLHGPDHAAWVARWRQRAGPAALWIGQAERVAYPWNEPDVDVWNPVTERAEPGWGVLPAGRRLKRGGGADVHVQEQLEPRGAGPLRPSAEAVFGDLEGSVVVGHLTRGDAFELDGVGADVWRALLDLGDAGAVAARVAAAYGAPLELVTRDVDALLDDLRGAGLLVEVDP